MDPATQKARVRTDYKGMYEAERAKCEQTALELQEARRDLGNLAERVNAMEAELQESKRRIERAKLEGIQGVTAFLLSGERD